MFLKDILYYHKNKTLHNILQFSHLHNYIQTIFYHLETIVGKVLLFYHLHNYIQSFFDHFLNFLGWKCINCGKVVTKTDRKIEFDSFSLFYQQQKCKNKK